jgi:predicted GNAT family N-acyltransferase
MADTSRYFCVLIEFGTPAFAEALQLRYDVLRKPMSMEFNIEDIEKEYNEWHWACYDRDTLEIAGVLTLKPLNDEIIKMRQVAVSPSLQSRGIGKFMVQESERLALEKGYSRIELHARESAGPFYKSLGYSVSGDIFEEVGIPHLFMSKNLK